MASPAQKRPATRARFRQSESGATAVEFALIAVPFLFLIFAILETGIVFAADILIDRAAEQVSREIRTGQIPTGVAAPARIRGRACDMMIFMRNCDGLAIDVRSYDTFAQAANDTTFATDRSTARLDEIKAGKIMALRLRYDWNFKVSLVRRMSSLDGVTLAGSAVFRTERF